MAAGSAPADLHDAPPAFVADAAVDANERIEPLHGEPTSNSLSEEKQGRRRRRRRGGRGGEGQDGDAGAEEALGALDGADSPDVTAVAQVASDAPAADAEADDQGEGHTQEEGRRRRRRGPRRDRSEEGAPVEAGSEAAVPSDAAPQQLSLGDAPAAAPLPPQAAEPIVVAAEAPIAPAPVAAAAFVLPLTDLQQLAQSAGLSWVHSDADKVAAAQAAIAAEPKPVRVPRERPPVVNLDEGPLVLVETKKDLSQVKLPFDQ